MNEDDATALLINSGCSQEVIGHCKLVAQHAKKTALDVKRCAEKKEISIDIDVNAVFLGAMLHDIGRSKTHGIRHAVEGAKIATEHKLSDKVVKIIERHIGAGIPREEAVLLGLPEKDYMPLTIEEKIVAHADNLVLGSRIATIEEVVVSLRKKKLDEKIVLRIVELNDEINAILC